MTGAYDRYDPLTGIYLPADLQPTVDAAKAAAAETSADSYTVTIDMPLVAYKKYKLQAAYRYKDPETGAITEGPRSPWIEATFDIPNKTLPVTNLVLTPGIKGYGVKFDTAPLSEHEDIIVYESLTGVFGGEEYIVWVGTSNSLFVNTSNFAPRWVKVVTRDKWLDVNISSAIAGPVTPQNADPDTSTAPSAPSSVSVTGSIDENDKSGFSGKLTASWSANADSNTSGYVLRWTTQNQASTPNPLWEYGQVDGKATTTFDITGLIPNTLYYWQVTAKSPYNALTWVGAQSGTVGPIVDANAPADVFAQLRSILSIGGKTADLFKIGTGISQSINTSTTITPSQTAGIYSGIILNKSTTNFGHNYWLNTGQFRVGSPSAFLFWDGSDLYTTGKINATGGSFSGDVQLNGGSLYAGASPSTGARVRLNSSGLFAYDANNNQTISISQVDGKVDARKGYIGGWTIDGSAQTTGSIYSSNTRLDSNGTLTIGDTAGTLSSIVRLSATDSFRIWVGSQSSSNAAFKVHSNGTLYATGAQISGSLVINSGTTYDSIVLASSTATSASNTATAASETAATAKTRADQAYNQAVAAGNAASVADGKAVAAADAAALKMATGDINTVLAYNTTIINGDRVTTGTIDVSRLNITGGNTTNGFAIDGNGIRGYSSGIQKINISSTGTISLRGDIYAESGNIGGFDIGSTYGDLTARSVSSVRPRIIFGSKVMMGWISSSNYGLLIGNSYDTTNARFVVNTADNVFRASIDTTATSYAFEVRNAIRARDLYYISGFGQVSSSRRFKENITYAPKRYYERILDVNPAFYVYKKEDHVLDELKGVHSFGMIAEDLEDAGLGYFVERDMNGQATNLLNMHELPQLLIPVVRDLKQEVLDLRSRLEAIENA
jgi:hypothetical protein